MSKMSFAQRVKNKAKEAEFSGGPNTLSIDRDVQLFKARKGKNEIIILPFEMDVAKNLDGIEVGEPWYRLSILTHFNVGAEGKTVICPRTVGRKCPICEHRAALLSQGRGTDDAEVREVTARKRELYWVIDLQDKDGNESPKIFECSYHNFGKKLEEEIREADDDSLATMFADPENGAVITVRMNEESMGKNKYLEASRFDFDALSKQEKKLFAEALEQVTPFGKLLIVLPYDELKNLFYDVSDDDAVSDEDEAPARSRNRAARRDDDDDADEAPRGRNRSSRDDEDDEPKPRRRSSRAKDEDENENEEGEDEVPFEAPKSGRRAARDKDKGNEDADGAEDSRPRRNKPASDAEEAGEDESPKPSRRNKPAKRDCPGKGVFGEDCDTLDNCDECDFWADCRDLTDKFEADKKKK